MLPYAMCKVFAPRVSSAARFILREAGKINLAVLSHATRFNRVKIFLLLS